MIKVRNLTKRYPGGVALNDVSFDVREGEIVCFLGPNGAGKTTTMRILTGYIPASGGDVEVAGRNLLKESMAVRQQIGYLPENVPLYPEMRVDEYLLFRARIKGVPWKQRKNRIAEVKRSCGLEKKGTAIIGQLSKGYRQRVGLADALVHHPELLILDEPTVGLDPNQIRQIRELIQNLAAEHTVLLSTHLLSEVEMVAERVLIIHGGRMVASGTPAALRSTLKTSHRIVTEIHAPREAVMAKLSALPKVTNVKGEEREGWIHLTVDLAEKCDIRANIFEMTARNGWVLRELRQEHNSLEDVFQALTEGDGVAS